MGSGNFAKQKLQLITFIVVIIIFLVILLLTALVYNKYRTVKTTINRVKSTINTVIPKLRISPYKSISYPAAVPRMLKGNLLGTTIYETTRTNFNPEIAKFLGKSILSSYNLSAGYNALLPPYMKMITKVGNNGYLFQVSDNTFIIAYRGTNSTSDILTDIDFSQVSLIANSFSANSDMNVMVHRGFYNLWLEQKDAVKNTVSYFKPGDVIYVTGHSLGATTACFTALDLSHLLPKTVHLHLYLYAPPRAGNKNFVDALSKYVPNNWAISNKRDIVVNLPPPTFSVLGTLWIYDDYKRTVILDIETGSMVDNHHVDTYMYAISNKADSKGQPRVPTDTSQNDVTPERIYWNRPSISLIREE